MNEPEIYNILNEKAYIIGEKTKYYILTIKKDIGTNPNASLQYNVLVLENSELIGSVKVESNIERKLLTPAKKKGVQLLLQYSSQITPEMVTMVHYKKNRPDAKPWQKDSVNVLESLFKEVWSEVLTNIAKQDIESEESQEDSYYKDGRTIQFFGTRYERNPINRAKAIKIHGVTCKACCFNFEIVYGERGKDFIEVHHIKPLSTIDGAKIINPETDLIPLCSNCHRMIHRIKDDVLTLDELKKLVNRQN